MDEKDEFFIDQELLDLKNRDQNLEDENTHHIVASWKNLTYQVVLQQGRIPFRRTYFKKILLKDINGFVKKGELMAIIGGSGAGKSTLLDILADRKTGGQLTGEILFNGKPKNQYFRRQSGYVMQDDVHLANLTVRENLIYSALLRLPKNMPYASKIERVDAVIEVLGLRTCRDTKVGNRMVKGISGGEARRLSIGTELLSGPDILFLDEPTSGLDSSSSLHVMRLLRNIASSQKRAIICSIHQPSAEVFSLFDKLLLLNKGPEGYGRVVYFGPADDAINYFEDLGFHATSINPAETLMDICAGKNPKEEFEDTAGAPLTNEAKMENGTGWHANEQIIEAYEKSEQSRQVSQFLEKMSAIAPPPHQLTKQEKKIEKGQYHGIYPTPYLWQLQVLGRRTWLNYLRTPAFFSMRIARVLLLSLIFSLSYLQMGHDQKSIQDRSSVLFLSLMTGFMFGMSLIPTFIEERDLLSRERAAKLYRISVYYSVNLSCILPFDVVGSLIYCSIVYWVSGLNNDVGRFFFFWFMVLLIYLVLGAFILFVSAFSPTSAVASAIAPTIFSLMMLYCGFLLNPDNIHDWLIWLYYLSPLKYALNAVMYNEFHGQTFACNSNEICTYKTGDLYLQQLGMEKDERGLDVGVLLIFFIFFRLMTYLCLRFRRFDSR